MAEPIQLTPEEIAAYESAASQAAPTGINPIRDLSADDLFKLATEDKDNFDLVGEFRRNKDLWGDQNIVQKIADVNNRVKQRGFELSDIPGPGKIAHTVFDIAKGFGKQAWNYANALIGAPIAGAIGEITGDASQPGFHTELAQEGQRRVMENLAGTEAAVHGMARMGEKLVRKVTFANEGLTADQKVTDLWKDVGTGDVEEDITKGKGGLLTPIGANVREELEAAGKPIRQEEVQALAAGDPASFWTFGKAFQGVGKGLARAKEAVRPLVPEVVSKTAETVAAKIPTAEQVAGKAVEKTGDLVDLGGKALKVAGPAVGFVKGAVEAGPLGALAGLKGGEIAAKISGRVSRVGERLSEAGREIAGKVPVTTAATQLAKDVAASAPSMASEITKGVAFDIGTAALTSETPKDTQSVGIGAFFGGMGAARRAGARIISGQIVGPRAWGIDKYIPPSGNLDSAFENMHIEATKDAAPAIKVRLNAIRQFLKGSHADTDVFLGKDAQAIENVLTKNGVSPEQARQWSQQEGFFTANIPGRDGKPRRVILARSIDAAPHEAFHAIQDVLGETANQHIDQIVREEYGDQWEAEGQRYGDRIAPGGDWRETVLDSTGKGFEYAKEKIAMAVANEYRAATGAEPPSKYVQERAKEILGQVMDRAVQANPNLDPNQISQHVWRDVLSPQEAIAVADSYLAREIAAENFDMVFKNLGVQNQPGLAGRLARVVAGLVNTLGGGEPLSPEVRSEIGQVAPRFSVVEAVRAAPSMVQPRTGSLPKPEVKLSKANEPLLPSPKPVEPVKPADSAEAATPADEARVVASEAPSAPVAGGTKSPRELLGTVAEAIARQAAVKINYLSAPDEPAAATTSNREARRALIEAFRTMPAEARALWEKTFFPERVLKLKGDKYQVLGWAPEVFAANAHKLAAKLVELGVAEASPYPVDVNAKTFTSDGWKELFKDTQRFVKNQMAGRTGAGEPLVVPKNVTDAGLFAPAQKASAGGLDQVKSDFINMLFNFRLPDTPRVQKGRLPLNIVAQDVSAATKPGRVQVPVIPRGQFEGAEAQRQGIEGRQIMEVNPLRQQIEAAAQAKGVAMPEFIEAVQRLNVENIKEVELAPEVPQFRGNTLTLSAGFQPPKSAEQAENLVKSVAKMSPQEFGEWAHKTPGGLTEAAHQTGLNAPSQAFVNLLKAATDSFGKKAMDIAATDIEAAMAVATQQQFFREAWEAATGEGSAGYAFRKKDPNWKPKFPVNVNTSETILQNKVLDPAGEISQNGGEMSTQLQPKKAASKSEFKMKPAKGGFSKAWILPDGTPVQLGGKWHHEFINESPELRSKYDLPVEDNTEQNRIEALKAGFVRVNWADQSGRITIEAREKDWPRQRDSVRSMVERNAGNIDHIKVYLFDDAVTKVTNTDEAKVFELDDIEKPAMIPFLDLSEKRATGDASDRLFQKAVEREEALPKLTTGLTPVDGEGYWVDPRGEFIQTTSDSHEMTAYEINKAHKLNMDLDQLQREMDKIGSDAVYKAMNARKYLRAYNVGADILAVEGQGKWEDLPRVQREKMEDAAIDSGRILYFNDRKIDATDPGDLGVSFQPKKVAEDYAKKAGIKYTPSVQRANVPEDTAKKVADFYESAAHTPDAPEVKQSYAALAKETIAQYESIKDAGYVIEPWTGEGEPYKSSADMVKDVNENKHLYFLPTDGNFQGGEGNPMLETSGVGDLLVNDVFRAVHDFFGHAKEGLQFGPKGEFNAWRVHSEMYSPEAQGALAAETLAQNFWVNYGKHLRRKDGSVPAKGDADFRPLADRPFAEQKNIVIPEELLSEVRAQFQPRRGDEDLFGAPRTYSRAETMKMSRKELMEAFPEAIVPREKDESIPSDITGSPLFKRAGSEEAAVQEFATKLVEFAKTNQNDPIYKAGVEWYEKFTPMLRKEFGEHADLFAELLAATSPQTNVETNFAYAFDALESFKSGRFSKILPKFNQGLEMIANDTWRGWYAKELKNIPNPPKEPTPAAFLEHWIFKHDLKPRQTNGKLYGIHSLPVLQVFARKWLTSARGPKTLNFVENLLGKSDEATIDLWADRTMRRVGYAGQERWRVLPKNIAPVTDKDFAFAQKAFRAAAEQLKMKPSALQAALWFAEKKLWANNGWSPLDLGDFRNEIAKVPMLRQGFQSRLTAGKESAKMRKAQALDLGLVEPRSLR